jgi:hypothetical protein
MVEDHIVLDTLIILTHLPVMVSLSPTAPITLKSLPVLSSSAIGPIIPTALWCPGEINAHRLDPWSYMRNQALNRQV